MKAGTTSLFRDLVTHPRIYLPEEKEPETLVKFGGDTRSAINDYRSLFSHAQPNQCKGEASTAYAKRPDYEGVADAAFQICGPSLKIIYLTRDPIDRIISQYRHEFGLGEVEEHIDAVVLKYPRYINYSRYEWQLAPWRAAFGSEQVMEISFEAYIADRQRTVREVCSFVGADPDQLPDIHMRQSFNANDGKQVPRGIWKWVVGSRQYQRNIKPLIPHSMRQSLARRVLSPAATASKDIGESVRCNINETLAMYQNNTNKVKCE